MSSMTTSNEASHSAILSDSLERLQLESEGATSSDGTDGNHERDELGDLPSPSRSARALVHDGYGFRPPSGTSTPSGSSQVNRNASPLPDRHGLGWPGEHLS